MRKLSFGVADFSYEMMYQATLFTEPAKLDHEDHVLISKIRARFRAIGEPNLESWDRDVDPRQRLVLWKSPKGGDIILENQEWQLLRDLFKQTKWKPFMAEEVVICRTLLEGAAEHEPVVTAPTLVKDA